MLEHLVGGASDSDHPFYHKSTGLRIVVGFTSGLSIVGSLLIALSYICFKDLRTKAREILMHISFMDFGVAVSNLVGIGVDFGHYYEDTCNFTHHSRHGNHSHHTTNTLCHVSSVIHNLCMVQGGLAIFSTLGSIMWTICLSMYLYILVSQKGTREAKLFVKFAYFFCYLMPVGILVWLAFTKRIGYSPYESTGWCGSVFVVPKRERDIYGSIVGYNLWICLTFMLVPVLSIAAHMYIRDEVKTAGSHLHSNRLLSALQKLDYKFLLVPVAFILLRIWSFLGDVLFVYSNVPHIKPHPLAQILMFLEGIGDSGQGIANALLFVLFTKKVRERFVCCWRHYQCCRKKTQENAGLLNEAHRRRVNSGSYSIEGNYTPPPSTSPRGSL